MARTLAQQIVLDGKTGGVFLPVDEDGVPTDFNQLVWLFPEGDPSKRVQINVVFDEDALRGSNQNWGDANQQAHFQGKRLRETAIMEVAGTVTQIRDSQPDDTPDIVKVNDNYWAIKRPSGRDSGMKAYECVRVSDVMHKRLTNLGG